MTDPVAHFSAPQSVAHYADNARRLVPGLADLHRMTLLLLSETAPAAARVLVLGAGGGMELKVFAENRPGWRFDGVDPAPAMLTLARDTLGSLMAQVTLHHGYVDSAPPGPFDAACCLLTLHFLPVEDRLRTLQSLHHRLKPGAPFVMAHHSFAQDAATRALWTRRFAAYGTPLTTPIQPGPSPFDTLPVLSPEQDQNLLTAAGFTGVTQFYEAFTFRGWHGLA
ncbi:MAG: class I SAM-dependent methyltransferase [Candidatus Saccharibacteria bacterium]|nr:class I SAM-dependent methyltransferase [Pseudorhodobacter sp.]